MKNTAFSGASSAPRKLHTLTFLHALIPGNFKKQNNKIRKKILLSLISVCLVGKWDCSTAVAQLAALQTNSQD